MKNNINNKFDEYIREIDASLVKILSKVTREKSTRNFIDRDLYLAEMIKKELVNIIGNSLDVETEKEFILESPPEHIVGDFSINVVEFAKQCQASPEKIGQEIVEFIKKNKFNLVKSASVTGIYVNVVVNRDVAYNGIIKNIADMRERYGESDINAGKLVVIDYSSPNIAKPIGVGHLRSTIIGEAMANIYYKTGYSVVRDDHLGDWGTQFGSLIYAYDKWGVEHTIMQNPIRELKNLYVRFHEYAENHPDAKDDARELFSQLEKHDPKMVSLWKKFRDLSLKDFQRVYSLLSIKFDLYIGESFYAESANSITDECLKEGYCKIISGTKALVVENIGDLPSFLLRKQDGASLYITRDLATLKFRVDYFMPDMILYVVGSEQDLNFKQLFSLSKAVGYLPDNVQAKHIGFGMVLRGGKKMSTRKGTLIELDELIRQAIDKSKEVLIKRNPDYELNELTGISEIVGLGAIIYNDLHQSRIKNISFDWERMLNLEGGSAIYLQYTYVRIRSIINKLENQLRSKSNGSDSSREYIFEDEIEFRLAKIIMMFPEIIIKSQQTDSPHHICGYLEELALVFNSFYGRVSIIQTTDEDLKYSRVELIKGVAHVIREGLKLLCVKVPDRL
jgi:arginyl-tRNA synthetase